MMEKEGHKVLRNAPYHCRFNPIENVWGISKRQYVKLIDAVIESHTTERVIQTWEAALNHVTVDTWSNCVDHCEKLMQEEIEKERLVIAPSPEKVIVAANGMDSDSEAEEILEMQRAEKLAAEVQHKDMLLERVMYSHFSQLKYLRVGKSLVRQESER
jgi:hypothetical protein